MRRILFTACTALLAVSLAGCPPATDTQGTDTPATPLELEPTDEGPVFSDAVTEVDEFAPDFVLLDTDGNEVTKAGFSGKVLVLDFWSTICKPCLKKLEAYEPIIAEHADKGVELLAVSLDSKPEVAAGWAKKTDFPFPIAMMNDDLKAAYFPGQSSIAVPQVRIIDRDGNLRFSFNSNSTVQDMALALAQLAEEMVGGDEAISDEVLSEQEAAQAGDE